MPKVKKKAKARSKIARAKLTRAKLNSSLHRRTGGKKQAARRQPLPTEMTDLYERAQWRQERREYWRNRLRRLVANMANRSSNGKGKRR